MPVIASQARPRIFDLEIKVPEVLYERVVEVDEEVVLPLGDTPDRCGRQGTSQTTAFRFKTSLNISVVDTDQRLQCFSPSIHIFKVV